MLFKKIDPLGKVSRKQKIIICLAAGGDALLGTIVHAAYLKYYTDFIGLPAAIYGLMYLIFGIWNAINDPLLGLYSDNKKYVSGKGKTVLLMKRSFPIMVVSMIMLSFASPDWNDWVTFAFLLAVMFLYDTASTLFGINYKSYILCLATSPESRTEFFVIQRYVSMIPAFIAGLVPVWFLTGDYSLDEIRLVFTVVGLIGGLLMFMSTSLIKDAREFYEHMESHEKLSLGTIIKKVFEMKSFVTYIAFAFLITGVTRSYYTLYVYYMDNVMNVSGDAALAPDIAGAILQLMMYPLVIVAVKKYGSKFTLMGFAWFSIAGFVSLLFIQELWQAILSYMFIMTGFAAFWGLVDPMFGTVIDEYELRTGERKAGFFLGLMAVITIPAQSFLVFVYTLIITYFGYDGTTTIQTATSEMGIRLGVGLLPAVFLLICFIPLAMYPINKKREMEIKKQMDELHHAKGE